EESASHVVVWAGQIEAGGGGLKVLCSGEALRRFETIGLSQIIQIEEIAADKRPVRYPVDLGSSQPVEIGMDGPREATPSPAEAELRGVETPAAARPAGARDVPPARPEGEAARAPAEARPSPATETAPHGGGGEKEPRQHGERAGGDLKWVDHGGRREKQPPQHRRHTRPYWAKGTILPGVLLGAVAVAAVVLSLLFREGKTTTLSRPVKPPARRHKEGPAGEAEPPPPAEKAQDGQEPGPRGRSLLGPVGSFASPTGGPSGGSATAVPYTEGEDAGAFAAEVRRESEERMRRMAAGVAPLDATVFRGHGYKLFEQKMRWHEAKLFCEALGGHLVTITSKEENRFVTGLARRAGVSVWLGFTDERKENKWEWVTGEKVGFTNWSPRNPDNFGGHEDWAEIRRERPGGPLMWNDVARGRPARLRSFVCEWERTGPGPGPDPKIAGSRPGTAGDDLSRLFSEFDLSVRKGDYVGARESMERAAGAPANAGIADTLRAAARVAGLLEERRGLIRRAAEIRIGLEITLGTKAGKQKGRLVSFDRDSLTLAIKRRAREGGTFEANQEIPWKDLLPESEEGFAADWQGEGADGAIARMYVALGRGNAARAENLLSQAGSHPLAVFLRNNPRGEGVPEPKEEAPSPKTAEAEETPSRVDVDCPACGGDGLVSTTGCPACDADGYDGASSCTTCSATGRTAYNCFACVGGGSVLAGGKQVECGLCGGKGKPPCPACRSTGKISRMNPAAAGYPTVPCVTCGGKGFDEELKCWRCVGTGEITVVSSHSITRSSYTRSCKVCGGDGLAPPQCRPCRGRGYRASGFQGRVAACLSCAGTGRSFVHCRACRGRGWQRARPDAAITPSSRQ
ncbi:MAG: C-type lectin domain-containing protein, partial [Planctomycetota bacterium]